MNQFKTKDILLIILFSCLFGCSLSCACKILYSKLNLFQLLAINLIGVGIFALITIFFCIVNVLYGIKNKENIDAISSKNTIAFSRRKIDVKFLKLFILYSLCYCVCFLAYYPGVGMNDALNIIRLGMQMANQFPIFYCAWVCEVFKFIN